MEFVPSATRAHEKGYNLQEKGILERLLIIKWQFLSGGIMPIKIKSTFVGKPGAADAYGTISLP